jgi:hypothetical protein
MSHQVFFLSQAELFMSIAAVSPYCLAFFGTPLVIEPSADKLSGNGGLLPPRPFDQRRGLREASLRHVSSSTLPARTHPIQVSVAPRTADAGRRRESAHAEQQWSWT